MKTKKLGKRLKKAAKEMRKSIYAADGAVAAAVKPYRKTAPARAAGALPLSTGGA